MGYYPVKFGGYSHFGSEVIMNLVCHVILQDHAINVSCDFMGVRALMVSHHPVKFDSHRRCVVEI